MALPKPQLNGDVLAYDEIQTDYVNDLDERVKTEFGVLNNAIGGMVDYVSYYNGGLGVQKWQGGHLNQWQTLNITYKDENTMTATWTYSENYSIAPAVTVTAEDGFWASGAVVRSTIKVNAWTDRVVIIAYATSGNKFAPGDTVRVYANATGRWK